METKIKEAIEFLRDNGYYVTKIPEKLCEVAEECSETGHGGCMECGCFVCLIGNDY